MPTQPGTPAEPAGRLVDIDETECWHLLGTVPVGRLAVTGAGTAPSVFPVTFLLDEGVIVFRTGVGEKLLASSRGPVSFQADSFDAVRHTGWSVLVRGVAYEAGPSEVEGLKLLPWAPGERDVWLRLVPDEITGRRIVAASADTDEPGSGR